jgi:CBS domain containing-hemolysin-like protein
MSTTPPPSGSSPANSALTLDAPHETTLAGHVSERLDRVPTARRTVELDGPRLEVIAGDDTQITQLAARGAVREREPKR